MASTSSAVLSAMFVPLWAFEGSQQQLMHRLSDPETRERIVKDSKQRLLGFARLPGGMDRWFPKQILLPLLLVLMVSPPVQFRYESTRPLVDTSQSLGAVFLSRKISA